MDVPTAKTKVSFKVRIEQLVSEYGAPALGVYFAIFSLVLLSFVMAIKMGLKTESTMGTAGTLGAAWLATKVTQPLRIIATVTLTPFVMRVVRRFKARGDIEAKTSGACLQASELPENDQPGLSSGNDQIGS